MASYSVETSSCPALHKHSFRDLIFLSAVLLITFLSFLPSLHNEFANWDDKTHLLENPSVLSLNPDGVVSIFQSVVNKTYIPLTILSFAVEHHFFGFNPFVFHLDNLLLHLGITALIFLLGLRMGLTHWGAGAAALLFGIHPMHVESVAWVTERKDVLYAFFYMLALYSYWRYLEKNSRAAYVFSVASGLLSLLAKSMALSLPLILLLFDRMRGRRLDRKSLVDKIPFFIYTIPITWITYALHTRIPGQNIFEAPLIWMWSFSFYLQKFFFPVNLSPLYQLPVPVSLANPVYMVSLVIFLLTGICLWVWRKDRWFCFAVGYYILSIFFLLRFDVFDGSIVADRFMYLPSAGICLWFGHLCSRLRDRVSPRLRLTWAVVIVCLMLTLALRTYDQCKIWKTPVDLWTYVIFKAPDHDAAYNYRADAYIHSGKYDLALADLTTALALPPDRAEEFYNRGVLYKMTGQSDLALKDFDRTLEINPKYVKAYNNRAFLLAQKNDLEGAVENFTRALEVEPMYAGAYLNRGMIYESLGRYDLALADYSQAIAVSPNYFQAYGQRSKLHARQGEYQKALDDALKARSLGQTSDPRYLEVLQKMLPR